MRGDAHEILSLFFKKDYVPPKMVMCASKEQTLGSFRKEIIRGVFPHKENRDILPVAISS